MVVSQKGSFRVLYSPGMVPPSGGYASPILTTSGIWDPHPRSGRQFRTLRARARGYGNTYIHPHPPDPDLLRVGYMCCHIQAPSGAPHGEEMSRSMDHSLYMPCQSMHRTCSLGVHLGVLYPHPDPNPRSAIPTPNTEYDPNYGQLCPHNVSSSLSIP